MSLFRWSDYSRKKEPVKKTKLPTQSKTNYVYCRNCNCKNKTTNKICQQCEVSLVNASKRRLR